MKKEKKSNVFFKKSSGSSLFLYLLIYVLLSIIFIPIKLFLMIILAKLVVDVSLALDTVFNVCINVLLAFCSTLIFVKIFEKKYKITDSIESFLHKFLIFVLILSCSSIIINLVLNTTKLHITLNSMNASDKYIIGTYQYDENELDSFVKGTPYKNYESYNDLFEISNNLRFEAIYTELIQPLIYDLANILSIIFFMELLIRKNDIFIGDA